MAGERGDILETTARPLTSYERRRLALECYASERTVKRAYAAPDTIREATRLRISRAALALGYPEPPSPPEGARAGITIDDDADQAAHDRGVFPLAGLDGKPQ
jgi:hypothetical protein